MEYTYDAVNRLLTKSGTNTTTDNFWYSPDGRKMAASNSVSTDSVYLRADGWTDSVVTFMAGRKFTRIYKPNDVQQLDSLTFSNTAGMTFAPRHYGPLQTLWPSLNRTNAVQDEVGNVMGLLNGTPIDQQVVYDDWGAPTITGSPDNRLLFKGLWWESNYTGMYYVRARWQARIWGGS